MIRHQPTEAEREAAKARRDKFSQFCRQVADMTEEQRAQLSSRLAGLVTCEGHALSLHNSILLGLQMDAPTIVGGFNQWKRQGRHIIKDQHGLMLWIPRSANIKRDAETDEPNELATSTDRPGFFMGTVFDISQTEAQA